MPILTYTDITKKKVICHMCAKFEVQISSGSSYTKSNIFLLIKNSLFVFITNKPLLMGKLQELEETRGKRKERDREKEREGEGEREREGSRREGER